MVKWMADRLRCMVKWLVDGLRCVMEAVSSSGLSKADGSCVAAVVDVTATAGLRGWHGYTTKAAVLDCSTCPVFTLASGWGFDSALQTVTVLWSIIPDRRM